MSTRRLFCILVKYFLFVSAFIIVFHISDVVIVVKKASVHVYCNPVNFTHLFPFLAVLKNLTIHCLSEIQQVCGLYLHNYSNKDEAFGNVLQYMCLCNHNLNASSK